MSSVAPRAARFGWSLESARHRARRREDPAVPAVLIATADPALHGRWKGGLQGDYNLRDVSDRSGLERTMATLVPDVLLLDIDLLAANGMNESFIRELARDTKVVVHSASPNEEEGIRVLKAGAKGYCRKDVDPQVLRKIVDRVHDGEIWAERKLIPRLLEEYTSHPEERPEGLPKTADRRLDLLTPREREIAFLIGAGASNKEIAGRLRVVEGTVKAHLTATFRKLGFSDRLQLGLFLASPNFVSKRPVAAEDAPAATPIDRLGT